MQYECDSIESKELKIENILDAIEKLNLSENSTNKIDISQMDIIVESDMYEMVKKEIDSHNLNINVHTFDGSKFRNEEFKNRIILVPKSFFEPNEPLATYSILQKCLDDYTRDIEYIKEESEYQYTEEELKRKIKHSKNPMERMRLQKELGYLGKLNKSNKYTKKKRRK